MTEQIETRYVIACVCGRRYYVGTGDHLTCKCGAFYTDVVIADGVFRFNADTNGCFQ